MKTREIRFDIQRYNPEKDTKPYFQTYQVPCAEDWVVLDAINYIKENLDTTLTYRWSCHMFVCGSCGMMVNDVPKLSCKAFLRDYQDKITIEPLANFPIEKDLVIVLDDFIEKLTRVKPYLIPKTKKSLAEGTHQQTPAQLKKYKQYAMCINCLCCYAACPQYALIPTFLGPAVLALSHRYDQDSRDNGCTQRQAVIAQDTGIWDCSFADACSDVCPKNVDPAGAIQQMKITNTVDWYLSHLGLKTKTAEVKKNES